MTKASDNLFPKVIMQEAATDGSDFSNPAADYRVFFVGEDGNLHLKDSAGTVTTPGGTTADHNHTAAGGDGGDLDAPVIDGYAVFNEEAAPSTPSAGTVALYAKSDGRIYSMDDAGVETGPFDTAGGGGGGPLLYVDSLALHADGDDFPSATLSGWTLAGGLVAGDITQVTTELYDDECVDIAFGAAGERIWKAVPASADYEVTLTSHGISANGGGMIGLSFTDNAGTGTGCSMYNDGSGYMWAISTFTYASSGSGMTFLGAAVGTWSATSNFPLITKLKKVGTTITGSLSLNGGVKWTTATRTDSTTFTRMAISAHFAAGTLRVGRFNVEEL
jgi:hypothetical protein